MIETLQNPPLLPTSTAAPERSVSVPMLCVLALAVGTVAAAGAVVFRAMISFVHNLFYRGMIGFTYDANHFEPASPWGPLIVLAPVIGGLAVIWLVRTFAPRRRDTACPRSCLPSSTTTATSAASSR